MSNVKTNVRRPVCETCGSGYIYITQKKIVCRRCGHVQYKRKTTMHHGGGES